MALNISVFKTRALSALVFVVVMLGGLVWNHHSFFLLYLAIALGCLFEYQKLLSLIYPNYKNISALHKWGVYLLAVGIMIVQSSKLQLFNTTTFKLVGTLVIPVILALMLMGDVINKKANIQNWAITIVGLLYIPVGLSLFYEIQSAPIANNYHHWIFIYPLLIMVSVWVNDTMAYIVGSLIGKHPISPISPNKTWEGTIGGVIISIFLVSQTALYLLPELNGKLVYMISMIAAVAGNYGDLFESKLKRMAKVKDSGNMMPGHGGFLDRFDSILFAGPFVWLLLYIMHHP